MTNRLKATKKMSKPSYEQEDRLERKALCKKLKKQLEEDWTRNKRADRINVKIVIINK